MSLDIDLSNSIKSNFKLDEAFGAFFDWEDAQTASNRKNERDPSLDHIVHFFASQGEGIVHCYKRFLEQKPIELSVKHVQLGFKEVKGNIAGWKKIKKHDKLEFDDYLDGLFMFWVSYFDRLGIEISKTPFYEYAKECIYFDVRNMEEIETIEEDFSDVSIVDKIVALHLSGVIDFLVEKHEVKHSHNSLSKLISYLIGAKSTTVAPYINALRTDNQESKNYPLKPTEKVDAINRKLIDFGVKA